MLGWIQLWAIGWKKDQPDVVKLHEVLCCMPAGFVHDDNVAMIAVFFRQFLHEQGHYLCITIWGEDGEDIAVGRIHGRIGVDILPDYLSGNNWPVTFWRPTAHRNIDPAKAGFVLKEDLNWPVVTGWET